MKIKYKEGIGWAWALKVNKSWELCHWSEPSKQRLDEKHKPSKTVRAIRVRIVPFDEEE